MSVLKMPDGKLTAREKLRLLKSPLAGSDNDSDMNLPLILSPDGEAIPNLTGMGDRVGPVASTPEFQKVCSLSNSPLCLPCSQPVAQRRQHPGAVLRPLLRSQLHSLLPEPERDELTEVYRLHWLLLHAVDDLALGGTLRCALRHRQHLRYVSRCLFPPFATDMDAERVARAIHLGVLVGFAVVAPDFDPSDQKKQTMRTMCKLPTAAPCTPSC